MADISRSDARRLDGARTVDKLSPSPAWWARLARENLALNGVFLCVIGAYFALTALAALVFQVRWNASPWPVLVILGGVFAPLCGAGLLATRRVLGKAQAPSSFAHAWSHWGLTDRLRAAVLPAILMSAFFVCFSTMKGHINQIHPFNLDPMLVQIDRALHGGTPWSLLQPIVGRPWISFLLSGAYTVWFATIYVSLVGMMLWIERPRLRIQYLCAFVLTWSVMGLIGATLLSSVGPVFYGDFYPTDPFVAMKTYLAQANQQLPVFTVPIQQMLLRQSHLPEPALGTAISAMPSMHVATSTLIALLGWRISRWIGLGAALFLGVIMVASVHLGYHYAVDGYVSIAGVLEIWWFSGQIAKLASATPDRDQRLSLFRRNGDSPRRRL